MSRSTTPAGSAGHQRVLTIDWSLLGRRLLAYGGRLFTSARHRAANTEYIPPTWMGRLHLSWFRLGLIGLVVFVFTQKQVDVTVSMGADGVAVGAPAGNEQQSVATVTSSALSMLPSGATTPTAAPAWHVNGYDDATVRAYVERFARVARTEQTKFGIPTPAKLAMAILESEAGTSAAARNDNNHFPHAAAGKFYDNAWTSWRAHSEDVSRRFPELADHADYRSWIAALTATGYSRDADYGRKLLALIDHFGLDR